MTFVGLRLTARFVAVVVLVAILAGATVFFLLRDSDESVREQRAAESQSAPSSTASAENSDPAEQQSGAGEVVARVGAREFTRADLEEMMIALTPPAQSRPSSDEEAYLVLRDQALHLLVRDELLRLGAAELGVSADPDEAFLEARGQSSDAQWREYLGQIGKSESQLRAELYRSKLERTVMAKLAPQAGPQKQVAALRDWYARLGREHRAQILVKPGEPEA